mgnify:CR=1 FL=1
MFNPVFTSLYNKIITCYYEQKLDDNNNEQQKFYGSENNQQEQQIQQEDKKEQIIDKELLTEKIWGYECESEYNNVEVYISFLRKKNS